ncbi:GIY-YIG nuclease family protein [Patescibacteria group bacterium]|nr:GIY-YIG nuclease family protein [Patescibacteria group bacterium]MBU1951336.1 GIY-YIG nuclease family protein [Patescibacteria group bacterium]MBU2229179.1 GIY-YIG nuclease family protein [Patescibacteria group bacterium]MBU2235656.1 GIY-YIG nuclease family protein [Patescibacteria group bacterium]
MFHTYAIHNRKHDKIYVGHTSDLKRRLERHNGKIKRKNSSYTAKFSGKWVIIYSEDFETRAEAIHREGELKSYQGREFIKNLIK